MCYDTWFAARACAEYPTPFLSRFGTKRFSRRFTLMKIGLLTFHHAPSYGAFFQAYAFSIYLRDLGHQVEIIDYLPEHRKAALRRKLYWKWCWGRCGLNARNLINLRNRWVFARVSLGYLPVTKKRYGSLTELQLAPPELDVCFFGSDQIWNYEATGGDYDGAYFGAFGNERMLRVAYAASFGKKEVPLHREKLREYLGLLDSISVRETSAVDIVKANSNRKPVLVLDPTFLIEPDQYPYTNEPTSHKDFILSYFLVDSSEGNAVLDCVRAKLGMPVVDVRSASRLLGRNVQATPMQLIQLIRSASHVVTDSFHGVALSIIFQVDFTAVSLVGRIKDRVIRVTDLLSQCELLDRFVHVESPQAIEDIDYRPILWDQVDESLARMKCRSKEFIARSLAGS
jgi:hypothetical protein